MHHNRIRKFLDNDGAPARALARYKISSSLDERFYATTNANHNVRPIENVFVSSELSKNTSTMTRIWRRTRTNETAIRCIGYALGHGSIGS